MLVWAVLMHELLHWVARCAALSVAAESASPGALAAHWVACCATLVRQLVMLYLVHWLLHWVACYATLVWQLMMHPLAFNSTFSKKF